ncbi:hypothetical protein EG68_03964 [Paragonimus skrjabini miyazakii]|uniref:Uncharacterized protein n=1 Tax=Paragonimus skrjabini miyazakii TaxID=59628 RepID=A0A8S9Z4V3_9TREM|nr:hypothetical protein EG68_03964 [Paragonimus skrjabini miyazakii]
MSACFASELERQRTGDCCYTLRYEGATETSSTSYRVRQRLAPCGGNTEPNDVYRQQHIPPSKSTAFKTKTYVDPDAIVSSQEPQNIPVFGSLISEPVGPVPKRSLIKYDDLCHTETSNSSESSGKVLNGRQPHAGHRWNTASSSTHKSPDDFKKWPLQFRKPSSICWPTEDACLSSNFVSLEDVDLIDLRDPWIVESTGIPKAKGRHLIGRTVVLLPGGEPFSPDSEVSEVKKSVNNRLVSRTNRLLVSATTVANLEAERVNRSSLASRLGPQPHRMPLIKTSLSSPHRSLSVWQRLG